MEKGISETLTRFFFPKAQVHNHWYAPVDNFQFVTNDFYQQIEQELTARKVPGLEISRVELSEGGLLSSKREYLRLARERLVFDICAAPFGTGYFFSFRFVELPLGVSAWHMLAFLIGIAVVFGLSKHFFGWMFGIVLFVAIVGGGIWFLRNLVTLGLKDLDATLLKLPGISPLYEIFFRKETYYREDTRLMYLNAVNSITTAIFDEVMAAKGIKLVKRFERQPVRGEMYSERISPTIDSSAQSAS